MTVKQFWMGRAVCAAVACLTLSLNVASAESTWKLDTDGNWNVADNWEPGGVPNSSTTDVVIDGNPDADVTVTLDINAEVRHLTLDAGDALHIAGGHYTLSLFGDVINQGLIGINPTGANRSCTFGVGDDLSLTGTGLLQLGRTAGASYTARITADGDATLTQQAGHTIAGVGEISASLVNHGTVRADESLGHGSELRLSSTDKVNTSLFEAVTGSTLNITGIDITNTGAMIRAQGAGAVVEFSGTGSILGGTLESLDGGLFTSRGTRTLENVTLADNSVLQVVDNGSILEAKGTLINQGLIQINPTGGNTTCTFRAGDDLSLTGTGLLQLGRTAGASYTAGITAAADKTITQQAGHTIAGVGRIDAALLNHGTVRADASLGWGSELQLSSTDKVNTSLFETVTGSRLNITGIDITNTGAMIRAQGAGAVVEFSGNGRIIGGILEALDGGLFTSSGTRTLENVTLADNSVLQVVDNGSILEAKGTLTNQGLIQINPEGGNTTCTFRAGDDLSLTGTGLLQLGRTAGAAYSARITADAGATLTQQAGHTIAGVGEISASLVNHGTVRADASLGWGSELQLSSTDKVNTSLFEAVTGSTLNITGIDITNTGAMIRAQGAGAVVEFSGNGRIIGGTLEALDGGLFTTSGTRTLENVTLADNSVLQVGGHGSILEAKGTLTNQGLIQINPEGGNTTCTFRAGDDLSLTGTGLLQLGRTAAAAYSALITADAGATLTQQAGHTIAGVGRISADLINHGTIRADASLGYGDVLRVTQPFTSDGLIEVVAASKLEITDTLTQTGGAALINGELIVDTLDVQGGSIGGTGAVTAQAYVAGTFEPGESVGTLTFDRLSILEGAGYIFEIDQTGADLIRITGLGDAFQMYPADRRDPDDEPYKVTVNVMGAPALGDYVMFHWDGDDPLTDKEFAELACQWDITPGYGGDWYYDTAANTITFTLVPEPATLSLLALGGLAVIRRRRESLNHTQRRT